MISQPQFQTGQALQNAPSSPPPLSLSKNTTGSTAARTAWSTRSLSEGGPMSYSSRTRQTTFNWDDASTPTLPSSDKGAGRNG